MALASAIYFSFLASSTYPKTEGTAIAARIANITKTTIISTNVKPFYPSFYYSYAISPFWLYYNTLSKKY